MKIFKNLSWDELSKNERDSVKINESIITKGDSDRTKFTVHVKENHSTASSGISWHYMAGFVNLKRATSYALFCEERKHKYEYFTQYQETDIQEGGTGSNPQLDVMGELGWQLSSIVDKNYFIYKRIKVS